MDVMDVVVPEKVSLSTFSFLLSYGSSAKTSQIVFCFKTNL
jgi:hypothetical protein